MLIKAAVVREACAPFVIEQAELSGARSDELLVKIAACGVCHTDEFARNQVMPIPLPLVLGHEGSGTVEWAGPEARGFKPGDRVVFSFACCDECDNCLSGIPARCDNFPMLNFGGYHADGTTRLSSGGEPLHTFFGQSAFATHAIVRAASAVKLPDAMPLDIAGPLGCGIMTGAGAVMNRLKPGPGSSIVLMGCGSVGLSAVMAAKLCGCGTIIGVDTKAERLEKALELGATHVINAAETQDVPAEVWKITGRGAHYAVDSTGRGECVRMSVNSTRNGGVTVNVGAAGEMTINVQIELMGMSRSLIGVVEGDAQPQVFIPELIRHYLAGRFPFDKLITFYDFDDINRAFEDTHTGKAVKAVLKMK